MHDFDEKKSYSEKLKNPRWQKKRLEIMKRDNFKCRLCGDTETTLNVHHLTYTNGNDPWEYDNKELITLCEHCHCEIEHLTKKDDEFNDISIHNLHIYKSDNWVGGRRIMFISIPGRCIMKIYDKNNGCIVGFNFVTDIPNIIKILKKTQRGI